jgi:hypothetical protein
MRQIDQRIYRTFEEFEREELRRMEPVSASVDDITRQLFTEELDFSVDEPGPRKRRARWDNDDEE